LKDLIQTEIDTPDGDALLEQIYITELGHVMARVYYKKKGIRINKRITNLDSLLENTGLSVKDERKIKTRKIRAKRVYKTTYG
jgi:hypothetical protein